MVADNRPVSVAVYGELFANGKSVTRQVPGFTEAQLLFEARADEDREFGAAQRAQHLCDAVFRFFNTGGTQGELMHLMSAMSPLLKHGPVTLPDGYFLLESYLNTDNVFEHLFISDTQPEAVVWVEDTFLDLVGWDQIKQRLDENGRIDSLAYAERLEAKRQDGPADLGQLPDRQDPGEA